MISPVWWEVIFLKKMGKLHATYQGWGVEEREYMNSPCSCIDLCINNPYAPYISWMIPKSPKVIILWNAFCCNIFCIFKDATSLFGTFAFIKICLCTFVILANQHIRMISVGSHGTEDWSNDAENSAFITGINYILKIVK